MIRQKYKTTKGAYKIPLLKGNAIVADPFYDDFSLLNVWNSKEVYFVFSLKENLKFTPVKENQLPENRHSHVLKDEVIVLKNEASLKKYTSKLRRVII